MKVSYINFLGKSPHHARAKRLSIFFNIILVFGPKGLRKACLWSAVAVFGLLLTGCTTTKLARREEVAQVRTSMSEELIGVKEEIRSLNGRIEELGQEIDDVAYTQLQQNEELNAALKEWSNETRREVQKKVADMEKQIVTLEKNQKQDKNQLQNKLKIVVEEVTNENKELRRQIETLRKSTAYTGTEGYYVVTQGDTLSGIARTFGVSMQSIMEVNDITDPDTIRIGQKLIIPEKNADIR